MSLVKVNKMLISKIAELETKLAMEKTKTADSRKKVEDLKKDYAVEIAK